MSGSVFPERIDLVVYINLDVRRDRREEIEKQFKRVGVPEDKILRWPATRFQKDPRVGCSRSHTAVLEYIATLPESVQTILILEDDFNFIDDADLVRESLTKFLTYPRDIWDVCMLSYCVERRWREDYNDLVSITKMSHRADGYLLNRSSLPALLDNFKQGEKLLSETGKQQYALDRHWHILQANRRFFYFNKFLGYQRMSYSNLDCKIVERLSKIKA